MTEPVAPEYQERIGELDHASSPTIQLTMPEQAPPPEPSQGAALNPEQVRGLLRSLSGQTTPEAETAAFHKRMEEAKPVAEEVQKKSEWKTILDKVLSTMTGQTSDSIQEAVVKGTLPQLVAPTALKTLDPFGNATRAVAEDTARRSGLDEEAVGKIAGASAFFAGLLFPGSKGSKAAKEIGAAATAAREAGSVTRSLGTAKRVVKVAEATTEQAKRVAQEAGDLVIGNRAIKIDYGAVDTTGELDRLLNRAADVVHDEFVAAKRGVIKDRQLAQMAKQAGIDLPTLLARTPGEIFTVEKQMAAQMAAGQLGLRAKSLAARLEALPPDVVDAATEEELRHTAMLLLSVVPQMQASISEAGRVLRIAGITMPGVQEARRTTEMLQLLATPDGTLAAGIPMRDLAKALATLDTPEKVVNYFRMLRGLAGGAVGAAYGYQAGEAVGDVPGGVAGAVVGGTLGGAAAVNPAVLMEAWINGLLSGSQTYIVNITTEMASTVNGVLERGIAATHGSVGAPDRVVPGEAMVMVHAAMGYLWREMTAYAKLLASEPVKTSSRAVAGATAGAAVSDDDTLVRNMLLGATLGAVARPGSMLIPDKELKQRALSAEGLGLSGPMGRSADVFGALLRSPSRGLVKADEWIKGMNVEMELWAQAHRGATLRGYEAGSKEYAEFVMEAFRNPQAETMARAHDYAAYIAFQSETNRAIAGVTAGNPLLRIVAPFTFTPTNILSMSFERMPIVQYASKTLRDDLAAGGAREQLARAKIDMGIAMTGMAWYLAAAGVIHGHGSLNPDINKLEREVLKQQPYSFSPTEGVNVNFNRFDPWAMHFGLVATIYEMHDRMPKDEWQELLGAAIVAGVDQWLNKSYLQNTSQFADALTEFRRGNGKPLQKFLQGLAGSAVPTASATLARVIDPKLREVDSAADAAMARVPGMSKDLQPHYDFFGQPVLRPTAGSEVLDALQPFYVQMETADAKAKFIVKELRAKQIAVTGPSRVVGGADAQTIDIGTRVAPPGVHLDDTQFATLQKLFGDGVRVGGLKLKDKLYDTMRSDLYRSLGPIGQQQYIKAIVSQFKQEALIELRVRDRVLDAKLRGVQRQRMNLTTQPRPVTIGPGLVIQGR